MIKNLTNYFLRGIFAFLPAGLTIYFFYLLVSSSEGLVQAALTSVLGDFYLPGMGIVFGIAFICFLGYFTTLKAADKPLLMLELPFKNVPIIKSIYSAIKSLSDYFTPNSEQSGNLVVVVKIPGFPAELVGLVTRKNLDTMPNGFTKEDRVAVFVPLSYQIGGLTMFLPRDCVQVVNIPVEVAMQSALTAWMLKK
jgi:uncharacterized membrane protein